MGEIFKDHVIAAAVLDRMLHHYRRLVSKGKVIGLRRGKDRE